MENLSYNLEILEKYIENENYRGYDPYDALCSPLFKLPVFRSNKLIRFTTQQAVKRSPINLRKLLQIPKGYNPVTLGLIIQGYCYRILDKNVSDEIRTNYKQKIELLITELENLKSKEFLYACWGYDFDWEAKYAKILAFHPTVVATGIITNALFIFYTITGNQKAKELLISSANFVLKDLNRSTENNHSAFCFSYSPYDKQIVYNASMKGSRLLAQVYSLTNDSVTLDCATQSIEFVINKQNTNGSWFYSAKETGNWVDNYHTGYVLDCLDEYIKISGDYRFKKNLNDGVNYYVNNLFENKKIPKFYSNKTYPVDCTAAGQAILTLIRFGYHELAKNVAEYMSETMQDVKGYFYFRNYGNRTDQSSFMRWSNAWMYAGLSNLLLKEDELQ